MNGESRRLSQVGEVVVDLPVFLTSPIYRRWHLHCGAAPDEVLASRRNRTLLEPLPER